jgi:hypothetical protein
LPERRADVIAREQGIALEISQMPLSQAEKLALWREKTKSNRAYWRRLREVTA